MATSTTSQTTQLQADQQPQAKGGGFWRRLAQVVAVAVFGPVVGGVIGLVIEYGHNEQWWKGGGSNPYADQQIEQWTENVFVPYYQTFLGKISGNGPTTEAYILKFNTLMEQLSAWQAYYEFVAIKENDDDEIEIAQRKAAYIADFILIAKQSWQAAAGNTIYSFYPYPFNPTIYTRISTENLDWRGVKTINAEKFVITDKPHGGLPPNGGGGTTTGGGGTTTGGGGTTTGGGGTTTGGGGTIKPPTGGNGGGTNPAPTKPVEYYTLSPEEKNIYDRYIQDKNLVYFNNYRSLNPNYKPSTALLKLLGLPVSGIPVIPGNGGSGSGNNYPSQLPGVVVKEGQNPNATTANNKPLMLAAFTFAALALYKFLK
jgi:hypothetical protein